MPTREQKPVRFVETPIVPPLFGVHVLDEHRLLLTGRDAPWARTLLHIWDLSGGEVVKHFFPPPQHLDSMVVLTIGSVYAAPRGDRIAAIHSLSDTLFFFDREGNGLFRVHIPVEGFFVPTGQLPNITSLAERQAWLDQFTLLSGLFWINDDELIVQWNSGSRQDAVYGLVLIDTSGRQIWRMERTPRLLGVRDHEFFFQDPSSPVPNRLIVAARKEVPDLAKTP